jgi:nucleotide-binding universal stress UspA family protein
MDAARVEIGKLQRKAGTNFPLIVSTTDISDALSKAATEEGIDLVVIGRGKVQKALGRFQSHAREIIRHAPCPVLGYSLSQQGDASSPNHTESQPQFAEA